MHRSHEQRKNQKGKLNMGKKILLSLDLQKFSEEDAEIIETGENEETETADQSEEETETESEETGEETGDAEPHEQTAEENARYAAIRRRAEEDARRKYEAELNQMSQQVAAVCQGYTHPITGQPITNIRDYVDALVIQQRQQSEQELEEKGIDPGMIDRMIASNPVVMQAQQVIEQTKQNEAVVQIQRDIAELSKYDSNIKSFEDLANLPNYPAMVNFVAQTGGRATIVDAYKALNFDSFMNHAGEAARQKAINQMRGKDHLSTQKGVATEDDLVEVPADIMARWKEDGKTEKQIRELYKSVMGKLH